VTSQSDEHLVPAETSRSLAFMADDEARAEMYAYIRSWLPRTGSFLDVGCGAGALVAEALGQGLRARGFDQDPQNVETARSAGLDVVVGDVFAPPYDDAELFDSITMVHFVEHFVPEDVATMLGAYARRLRRGGRLLVMTPNFADWTVASHIFWLDRTHVRPYPGLLLRQMLEEQGLTVIHTSTERLVRFGLRRNLLRPLGRLRFGREFERLNLVVVAERPG